MCTEMLSRVNSPRLSCAFKAPDIKHVLVRRQIYLMFAQKISEITWNYFFQPRVPPVIVQIWRTTNIVKGKQSLKTIKEPKEAINEARCPDCSGRRASGSQSCSRAAPWHSASGRPEIQAHLPYRGGGAHVMLEQIISYYIHITCKPETLKLHEMSTFSSFSTSFF